ncbi:MAG: DUF512 domain-containing protein [candidate division Zixibacteria bacterium]|nr:DUF512 domain-containing protein [candidate division Zixibacteria bacterium]
MRIVDIDSSSPLFDRVKPGYLVIAVNGQPVLDPIDFRFKTSEKKVKIRFANRQGQEMEFDFDDYDALELGLILEEPKVRTCNCNCIFCFIRQLPKGMRRSLYIKDEDYRLSFTHGNFITLSNTSGDDLQRIVQQRLSPLYISVHTTDDKLRRQMLRNSRLVPILSVLKYLSENRITLHTQVVLCPGINDDKQLESTIYDLASLYPGVESLAIVPVGLTKYRDSLPIIDHYTSSKASEVLKQVDSFQKRFLRKINTRFIWAADEFYILANRAFPKRYEYEEMPQFENGIGMVREAITMFNRRKVYLKRIKSRKRVVFLTGKLAFSILVQYVGKYVTQKLGLSFDIHLVRNRFFGESVTVSGLLTGKDLLREARLCRDQYDVLVLPPNCLNDDNLFLDDLTLEQFHQRLDKPVLVGQYNIADTIREAFV